jgi:hypothetical protein
MDKGDIDALRNAVQLLEHASLAARLANMIGKPLELLGRALPAGAPHMSPFECKADMLQESAFAVAIGGKADMPFCTAYVRF